MNFQNDLRACIEAETARTGETLTALARRASIAPNSLIRFMNTKLDRGLKLDTACQLIEFLDLRLVPADPVQQRQHLTDLNSVSLPRRNLVKLSEENHRLIEQARNLLQGATDIGNDLQELLEANRTPDYIE